jgi:hypothetical protein
MEGLGVTVLGHRGRAPLGMLQSTVCQTPLHFGDFGIKVYNLGDIVLGHTGRAPMSMLQSTVSLTPSISVTAESRSTKWGGVWVTLFWATQGGP